MCPADPGRPAHDEWHSRTVVLSTARGLTVIGRWQAVVDGRVQLLGVALHDEHGSEESRQVWIARIQRFGVPVEHETWSLSRAEVTAIVPLRDA